MAVISSASKERLEAVLQRAATDINFRQKLMSDPSGALEDSDLTSEEKELIASLKRVKLEEIGVDVRPYRAVLRDNGVKASVKDLAKKANKVATDTAEAS